MARRPVFWREGYMPEHGIRQEELDSYLRLIALTPVNVRDNAFERRFGLDVRQREPLPSINLRQQVNQRTVSTDSLRASLLFKSTSAGLSRNTHGESHQHALTPATVGREPGGFARFGEPRFENPKLLRLDGRKHQPHAFGRSRVDDPCAGFEALRALGDANLRDRP